MNPYVEVKHVSKQYSASQGESALQDVSFTLQSGQVLGL
ncbi:MAG: ABC transporter ATP-binding protein, partial [Vibrio fluvialis]